MRPPKLYLVLAAPVLLALFGWGLSSWLRHRAADRATQAQHQADLAGQRARADSAEARTQAALSRSAQLAAAAEASAAQAAAAGQKAAQAAARAGVFKHQADSLAADAEARDQAQAALPGNAPGDTLRPSSWKAAYLSRTAEQMATAAALAAKTDESEGWRQSADSQRVRAELLEGDVSRLQALYGRASGDLIQAGDDLWKAQAALEKRKKCRVGVAFVKVPCSVAVIAAATAGWAAHP